MRGAMVAYGVGLTVWLGASPLSAAEKPIEELPRDVGTLAFAWTEPIKSVAKQSRRFDPVSGLWFGLLDGTIKSFERTAKFFLFEETPPSRFPQEPGKQLRYTF